MERKLILLAVLFLAPCAFALDFPLSGFKIDPLEVAKGEVPVSPLVMCLPATEGFAPNVNVTIQPFPGTMGDYITVSKQEFEQVKWTLIAESRDGDKVWKVEYADPSPNNPLHFYAKAVSNGKYVYLVTGTARESQWATAGPQIKKCVDSLVLK